MNNAYHGHTEKAVPPTFVDQRWGYILAAGLVLATVVAYIPAISGNFVWDDDLHLTDNIVLQKNGLYRSWFTTEPTMYWPVTWTSYWLEYQIWGLKPASLIERWVNRRAKY